MMVLTEYETPTNQNDVDYGYNNSRFIKDVYTATNNVNALFGLSLPLNEISNFYPSDNLVSYISDLSILKSTEQSNYDAFQSKSKSDSLKEKIWGESRFHVEFFQNNFDFSESDKKINDTRFDFNWLLKLSPIIPQEDFMSRYKKYPLQQLNQKPHLENILLNLLQKFDISNIDKLKSFISTPMILEIPNLPERFDKIISLISSFMHKLDHDCKSKIDIFSDEEIESFQSITIECVVKNATSDQCIQWTESLVSEIIAIDENMLNIIQVEIIPDDVE